MELFQTAGKGLGWPTCVDRRERDGGRSSAEFCVADKVGPIPGISQVTLNRGSLDIPDSWDPIPDPQDPSSQFGFLPGLPIPGTGPPAGLRTSRSLRRFPVSTGFLISRSLAPAPPWVPRARCPMPERPRMAGQCSRPGALERAGSCWQDPLAEALSRGRSIAPHPDRGCTRSRPLSVVYVLTREPQPGVESETGAEAEPRPLRCLREACVQLPGPRPRPQLRTLPFGKLALGDTAALDSFYNAGECALGAGSEARVTIRALGGAEGGVARRLRGTQMVARSRRV